jgi:hypothetical protein
MKEIAVSPEFAAAKALFAKLTFGACDAVAISTCFAAAFSFVQGLFGAAGAILSVVYLVIRIRSALKSK